jgi:hypothetical protein
VKPSGRQIGKLSHSNPTILFDYVCFEVNIILRDFPFDCLYISTGGNEVKFKMLENSR